MQQRYLEQIERELPLPAQRIPLLGGKLEGGAQLREVATILFDEKQR